MGTPTTRSRRAPYLPLPLPLQVHHAHVHDGPQVGKGFHGHHVGALLIAVNIELRRKSSQSCSTPSRPPPREKWSHPAEPQSCGGCPPCAPREEAVEGTADKGTCPTGDPNQAGISNEAVWKLVESVCTYFSAEVQNVHILKGRRHVRP